MGREPSKLKIKGLNEKYILKKSVQETLPKKIWNRPKHPYRGPIKQFLLCERTSTYSKEILSDKPLKNSGYLKLNTIDIPLSFILYSLKVKGVILRYCFVSK